MAALAPLGQPPLLPGGLVGAAWVPLALVMLSVLLIATSTLRRALERTSNGKYLHTRGLSGFALLRHRFLQEPPSEKVDGQPSSKKQKRRKQASKKQQTSPTRASAAFV
eukprot:CAMPEP_0198491798 /NCGR_PEP_ID=MMETSP1462-20131121/3029_1 /TAXON_ID=1333877 /ORGANISM="Brandtodinium nutriculum, Strain RCC3387" /LENGTH=108 /DNA_ID=CAMNT_0044220423 /DNA_START=127 /DNA_END=450 /DNA_ORIENTATION=-